MHTQIEEASVGYRHNEATKRVPHRVFDCLLLVGPILIGPRARAETAPVTVETLRRFVAAFNSHDLYAVMSFFADDCVLEMPRGPEPWGRRYEGKAEVRKALETRFEGIPDVHYGDDHHWVSGDHGVSEWTPPARQGTARE